MSDASAHGSQAPAAAESPADASLCPPVACQPLTRNQRGAARRIRLRQAGICINAISHGPATHGVLCAACRVTHSGKLTAPRPALARLVQVPLRASLVARLAMLEPSAVRRRMLVELALLAALRAPPSYADRRVSRRLGRRFVSIRGDLYEALQERVGKGRVSQTLEALCL